MCKIISQLPSLQLLHNFIADEASVECHNSSKIFYKVLKCFWNQSTNQDKIRQKLLEPSGFSSTSGCWKQKYLHHIIYKKREN